MKFAAQIRELLNNGMHSRCLFHFVAENKTQSCLGCVREEPEKRTVGLQKKGSILVFGMDDGPLCSIMTFKEFYILMLGHTWLSNKLVIKEIIV